MLEYLLQYFQNSFSVKWPKLPEHSTWMGFSDTFGMTGVIHPLQVPLSQEREVYQTHWFCFKNMFPKYVPKDIFRKRHTRQTT